MDSELMASIYIQTALSAGSMGSTGPSAGSASGPTGVAKSTGGVALDVEF
jgi:hypothetical protein